MKLTLADLDEQRASRGTPSLIPQPTEHDHIGEGFMEPPRSQPSKRAWRIHDVLMYAFCIGCFAFVAVSAYLERTGQ